MKKIIFIGLAFLFFVSYDAIAQDKKNKGKKAGTHQKVAKKQKSGTQKKMSTQKKISTQQKKTGHKQHVSSQKKSKTSEFILVQSGSADGDSLVLDEQQMAKLEYVLDIYSKTLDSLKENPDLEIRRNAQILILESLVNSLQGALFLLKQNQAFRNSQQEAKNCLGNIRKLNDQNNDVYQALVQENDSLRQENQQLKNGLILARETLGQVREQLTNLRKAAQDMKAKMEAKMEAEELKKK